MQSLRFVDLFAGLGGFNLALQRLGHSCVFACELDEELRSLYEKNFGIKAAGDIREVSNEKVPEHDMAPRREDVEAFVAERFGAVRSRNGAYYEA